MKLQRWALSAEIISGFAVVITLIFLAIEIRSNTEAVRINTYDQLVADIADWDMLLATDNELGEAMMTRINEGIENMTDYQAFIDRRPGRSLYTIYERAFLQWEAGTITSRQFERFRSRICAIDLAESNPALDSNLRGATSQNFTEFRDQCVEN